MSAGLNAAALLAARKLNKGVPAYRPEVSGGAVAAVGLVFVLLFLLALATLIAPPLVVALLWFPALGLTGWAHFGATVAAFVVWWVLIRLVNRSRK